MELIGQLASWFGNLPMTVRVIITGLMLGYIFNTLSKYTAKKDVK